MLKLKLRFFFNLFRMRREEAKTPPYKFFSPATSLKGEFSFDHFAIPSTTPKLLNLNQEHHSKISLFFCQILKKSSHDNFSHENARVNKR